MSLFIDEILDSVQAQAVIFDLDGTLIDNNPYHLLAWKQYLQAAGREISPEDYLAHINGRTNKDAIEYIYQRRMTDAESLQYALQKEAIYRDLYAPFIKPVSGLIDLLAHLHRRGLPLAIATSGIQVNIDFMFAHIPIRKYFTAVVDSSHIQKGKPDPEIYLRTAQVLQVPAANCVVFEDALVGIRSAQAAGMTVVAVSTTHPAETLAAAEYVIHDFTRLLSPA